MERRSDEEHLLSRSGDQSGPPEIDCLGDDDPRQHSTSPRDDDEQMQPSLVHDTSATWKSFPHKYQLFLLALCRLSSPISQNYILPYLYYLLKWMGSSAATSDGKSTKDAFRISWTSSLLVAAFPLGQFATSMLWAYLSDHFGHKLMILTGLVICIVSNIFFGFSTTPYALIAWRMIAGMANGNIGVMRAMAVDIAGGRKHQTQAFLATPLVIKFGTALALLTGGCLSDPVRNYPRVFGKEGALNHGINWMSDYPFALPAIVNASFLLPILILVGSGLQETRYSTRTGNILTAWSPGWLNKLKCARAGRRDRPYAPIDTQDHLEDGIEKQVEQFFSEHPRAASPGIWTRSVVSTLVSFTLLPLHNSAFMHIFPLFLCAAISIDTKVALFSFNSGLGLSSQAVGILLSSISVLSMILQLFLYPQMQARLGTMGCFRIALFMFLFVYLFSPYTSLLSHHEFWRWPGITLFASIQVIARTIAMPSAVLLLTDVSPSKRDLRRIHSAGNMMASLAKVIGPALGGWIFIRGVNSGAIGVVWWAYLTPVTLLALGWSFVSVPR